MRNLKRACASAGSPKRVLILNLFGPEVAPFSAIVSAFRTTLALELGRRVDIYELFCLVQAALIIGLLVNRGKRPQPILRQKRGRNGAIS